jgi:hypothetical protein
MIRSRATSPVGDVTYFSPAAFDGVRATALDGFYVDSGVFKVEDGALQVMAESLGGTG